MPVSLSIPIRYHDMRNHIYKYEAHHDITTKRPQLPIHHRLASRLVLTISQGVSHPSRPVPLIPSRLPRPRSGECGIVGGLLLNAPFSEAHSSLPNTKRDTARARASFYLSPDPLLRALPYLRTSINPPPPGRGRSGRRERFAVAGMMMIAGEYASPVRSLAIARSLLPHSLRGAGICAVFLNSFFRCPIRGRRRR